MGIGGFLLVVKISSKGGGSSARMKTPEGKNFVGLGG
jgi:hypothetical protein